MLGEGFQDQPASLSRVANKASQKPSMSAKMQDYVIQKHCTLAGQDMDVAS